MAYSLKVILICFSGRKVASRRCSQICVSFKELPSTLCSLPWCPSGCRAGLSAHIPQSRACSGSVLNISSVGPQPKPEVWHQWSRSSSSAEGLQPQLKQGLTPHGLLQPETDKGRGTPGSWPGGDFLKPQETEGRSGELQLNCSPVLMSTTNTAPTAQAGTGRVQGNGKTFSRQAPQPGIHSNRELHV